LTLSKYKKLPIAKAKFARPIEITVKNFSLIVFTYFEISNKIVKKIPNVSIEIIKIFNISLTGKKMRVAVDSRKSKGNTGWNPFPPTFSFIKLIKSIPKVSLCSKNPIYFLSL